MVTAAEVAMVTSVILANSTDDDSHFVAVEDDAGVHLSKTDGTHVVTMRREVYDAVVAAMPEPPMMLPTNA